MEYPVTYAEFSVNYPELVDAASATNVAPGYAQTLFNRASSWFRASGTESYTVGCYGLAVNASPEAQEDAKEANGLALASLVAGYVRQLNVENFAVPGYDGQDAGINDAHLQGLQNTQFQARFAQNTYGRDYLLIIARLFNSTGMYNTLIAR